MVRSRSPVPQNEFHPGVHARRKEVKWCKPLDTKDALDDTVEREYQERKRRGEARLREVMEVYQVPPTFFERMGIHAQCEPWEALAMLEEKPKLFANFTAYLRMPESDDEIGKRREAHARDGGRPEAMKYLEAHARLVCMLNLHDAAVTFALKKGKADDSVDIRGIFAHQLCLENGRIQDTLVTLLQRPDYWNMMGNIWKKFPKKFQFSSAKEVRSAMTRIIDGVRGSTPSQLVMHDGMAMYDGDDERGRKLAELDKKDAEEVIKLIQEGEEMVKDREENFCQEMRVWMRDLQELNQRINSVKSELIRRRSFMASLKRVFLFTSDREMQALSQDLATLEGKRKERVFALHQLNHQKWQNGNFVYAKRFIPKFTSEHSPSGMRTRNLDTENEAMFFYNVEYRNPSEIGDHLIRLWTHIADADAEQVVNALLAER